MKIGLTIDGAETTVEVGPGETLMELLRRLRHFSVKNGCANGDCGTCAVLMDGRAVASCLLFAAQAADRRVTTIEHMATAAGLHPLQQALLDAGGVQCGFCIPGMLATALDLLARHPDPSPDEVRTALAGNLCRCTGYVKQIEGILLGAARMREGSDG
jgi:aerobic-type carbon monoxide dehydrogenase small subunit (CoxS/CutS family)